MTEVTFRSDMRVELVDFMGGDARIAQAARVSTIGAESLIPREDIAGLIGFLDRDNHTVPHEHSVFTFYVEAPIFVTRQMLKHRMTSISETSGRYRELEPVFYMPAPSRPLVQIGKTGAYDFVEGTSYQRAETVHHLEKAYNTAWASYESLLEAGIAKEVARFALPMTVYSSLYITLNTGSLMNFLRLRNEYHAQREIQEVSDKMEVFFAEKMPIKYRAFRGIS